ncbi:cyclic nucleotide-binding domain protein (macronuclear) [Tetrahymena thermophila SB210]|uniref:Cyclic nucleotide-binding domain protein n=1 Tax=Tetrahymena thermophila (strain SB210) TaxID=312017 RepID=I7M946_TETTS|nr:cyclic nucleotide-binding domain protein [Tetrahymena thermophila SB210]EAS00767.3 cyclic nucleotide-binding domain protein [Tetrahymena thermophila SB210]|eukprot:XP_001021012.3 cyclic nucleotide-binding domain protein [Tetrahymena thermophila SB210]
MDYFKNINDHSTENNEPQLVKKISMVTFQDNYLEKRHQSTFNNQESLLNLNRRKSSFKTFIGFQNNLNQHNKVVIQQFCPKTEGSQLDDSEDMIDVLRPKQKTDSQNNANDQNKQLDFNKRRASIYPQNLESVLKNNRRQSYVFQKQFTMNLNSQKLISQDQNSGKSLNQRSSQYMQQRVSINLDKNQINSQRQLARERLKKIFRKGMLLNKTVKIFAQVIGARYIQKKTEFLFSKDTYFKIDLQKSKYFDDMLQGKGLFSREYINSQTEFLKALLNLQIDLSNQIHAEIAVNLLKKKIKSQLEMQYLSKCLINLDLFKQNSNILEDQDSLKIIFSEINYVFFPKNSIIFNFGEYGNNYYVLLKGKVYCFIPNQEKKDQLIFQQMENERRAIKSKKLIQLSGQQIDNSPVSYEYIKSPLHRLNSTNLTWSSKQIEPNKVALHNFQNERRGISPNKQRDNNKSRQQNLLYNLMNENQQDNSTEADNISLTADDNNEQLDCFNMIMKQAFNQSKKEITINKKKQNKTNSNINEDIQYQQTYFPDMNMVKIYTPGEAFGEIALMTKERRTASMVCKEDSHLMVLSKEGFEKILGSYQQSIVKQKVSFLKSFSFFEKVANSQLMSFLHCFKILTFTPKSTIYLENDPANEIYLIKSGEVQIQKQIYVEQKLQQQLSREANSQSMDQTNILFNKHLQKNRKQSQKRIIQIKSLGPVQYFGQDEILSQEPKRLFRAVALQQTQLYIINKKEFFSFLKYQKQLNIFKDQCQVKKTWLKNREEEVTQVVSLQESNQKTYTPIEITPSKTQDPTFQFNTTSQNLKSLKDSKQNSTYINNTFSINNNNNNNNNNTFNNNNYTNNNNTNSSFQSPTIKPQEKFFQFFQTSVNNFEKNSPIQQINWQQQYFFPQEQSQIPNIQFQNESTIQSPQSKSSQNNLAHQNIFSSLKKKKNMKSQSINNASSIKNIFQNQKLQQINNPQKEEEEEILSKSSIKQRVVKFSNDLLQNKKKTLEKISNRTSIELKKPDQPTSHYLDLQKLLKINEQNQVIMKEIQSKKYSNVSVERLHTDGPYKSNNLDNIFDILTRSSKKEYKYANSKNKFFFPEQNNNIISPRSEKSCNNLKSFGRINEMPSESPMTTLSFSNSIKKPNYLLKSFLSKPQLDIQKKSNQNESFIKSGIDLQEKNDDSFQNRYTKHVNQSDLSLINNFTYANYYNKNTITNTHKAINRSQDFKISVPKNLQANQSLNELKIKSSESSPLSIYYDKQDDIKEDEIQKEKEVQLSFTSFIQQNSDPVTNQTQTVQKNKKNEFQQFFQNNEVLKNKSILKIIKFQQKNKYIFKQLQQYNSSTFDNSLQDQQTNKQFS